MTRIHYLDDGAPITVEEIYNPSAVGFAGNLKGGADMDEYYKYKYNKYKYKCNQLTGGGGSKKDIFDNDEYWKKKWLKYRYKCEKLRHKIREKQLLQHK